jgi:hypothetical protein
MSNVFNKCIMCGEKYAYFKHDGLVYFFKCSECGDFSIEFGAYEDKFKKLNEKEKVLVRHYLYKAQQNNKGEGRLINSKWLEKVLENKPPSLAEQADNLLLYLSEHGKNANFDSDDYRKYGHILGLQKKEVFKALIKGMAIDGLLEPSIAKDTTSVDRRTTWAKSVLTLQGWRKVEELQKGNPLGYKAFMAMQFGDKEMDKMLIECFKPAVKDTGYDLKKLDDKKESGIIDNILRQRIREARFVVVDLTHDNSGAYWEAGLAEGLGKPVIYTCKKAVFDGIEGKKPHFDVNHCQTVIWDPSDPEEAKENLKATIRVSIPEARW